MKNLFILLLLSMSVKAQSQNTGIGTADPATKLHVVTTTGNSTIRSESSAPNAEASLELKTNGGIFDFLELRKWMPGSGGSVAGIPLAGLSQITTGSFTSGGLLIGTKPAYPLYFTTDNTVRMQINATGQMGVGAIASTAAQLSVLSSTGNGINSSTDYIPGPSNFTSGVSGIVSSTSLRAHGITGIAQNASGISTGTIGGMYGVAGTANETGYGIGAFGGNGAGGIYSHVFTGTGKALRTFGGVQLEGIGAAAGRVLTSDASGNATWLSLPTGSSAWSVAGNNIYNNNSGNVGINIAAPTARLHIRNPSVDTNALQINHAELGLITRINGTRELYHEGDLWVHSAYGKLRYGYPDNGWYFATIDGGTNLQLFSHSTSDLDASKIRRLYLNGTNGNLGVNVPMSALGLNHSQLRVERGTGGITTTAEKGAILGISQISGSSGVYGITPGVRSGSNFYAGVTGYNTGVAADRFGVIGVTLGSVSGSVYSAGVAGYGIYGVLGNSDLTTGAGVIAQHATGRTALELNNGFVKVSGSNKTAFKHTTAASNIFGNTTILNYANPSADDILIITHNYSPTNTYLNKATGVFFNGTDWAIYNEDLSAMPVSIVFNVLVIKQ